MSAVLDARRETSQRTIRVLVVEDHPIVRQGYAFMVSQEPDLDIVAEADGVSDAIRLARETHPNLAIIDISLSEGSGIDLIKHLKLQDSELKMLAVSAHDDKLFAERALRAGASGFVNKRSAPSQLISAIRRVLEGGIFLSEEMNQRMLTCMSANGTISEQSPVERLSNRELEAFEMIGHGLTTREIARRMYVSPKTVERYRENIKHKLHLESAIELVRCCTQWVLENR
jgi:DNA-binding NarL/FixJ family response regulator